MWSTIYNCVSFIRNNTYELYDTQMLQLSTVLKCIVPVMTRWFYICWWSISLLKASISYIIRVYLMLFISLFCFVLFLSQDLTMLLCSPAWPQTLRDPTAASSLMQELKSCTTTPSLCCSPVVLRTWTSESSRCGCT